MPSSASREAYAALIQTLVAARREAGLTQAELAQRLKKPQSFVSKIETGERQVDVIEFYAIVRALQIDPEKLFGRLVRQLPEIVGI